MNLATKLTDLGFVYKVNGNKLAKLGISTIQDLLFHIPQRYEDLRSISKIKNLKPGETTTIQGTVTETKNIFTRRRFQLQRVTIQDESGSITCMWFNQPYILNVIKKGAFVSIAGRMDANSQELQVKEYEILDPNNPLSIHTGRLVPVYPETKGLSSKWIRNRIIPILNQTSSDIEYLPDSIKTQNKLLDLSSALQKVHFPDTLEAAEEAKKRLAYDELFLMQLSGQKKRQEWQDKKVTQAFKVDPFKKQIEAFWKNLPFELTSAQRKAIHEIFQDLSQTKPMNRLLEGDVGSGKTIVATAALYLACLNGFQGVFMAPTSILAEQHYNTISKIMTPLGVNVDLRTSATKGKIKSKLHPSPLTLTPDILIGTHAVLNEKVTFKNLGLVVIDEQQRFGVEQRGVLRNKGTNPHFLTMTATPIPRTVLLTMYGDLDLSVLDEMPKGRKVVKTWFVPKIKRQAAYEWIRKQIVDSKLLIDEKKNTINQVFIVCPFIEESETMTTVKAATKEYEYLKKEVFQDLKLGMLHGKMSGKEKNAILSEFQKQKFDILVTTPVVEVGIDIPDATVIVIEAAERFGLAQLHQLRGRVGRSEKPSFCLLFADEASPQSINRLKSLERSHQGAELAELDLKLRGPGDMYGTMQHGSRNLKIASFSDFDLIEKTKKDAETIIKNLAEYPQLQEKLNSVIIQTIAPD